MSGTTMHRERTTRRLTSATLFLLVSWCAPTELVWSQEAPPTKRQARSTPEADPSPSIPESDASTSPSASVPAAADARARAEALIEQLPEADASQRQAIETELAGLGEQAMIALKLAEISDRFEVRRVATETAQRVRWRRVIPQAMLDNFDGDLIVVMAGSDDRARAAIVDQVVKALGVKYGADAIGFLTECLADPQPYLRQRAIEGLGRFTDDDGEPGRGHKIALPTDKAAAALRPHLASADAEVRLLVVRTLSEMGQLSVAELQPMLETRSIDVKRTVIQAIGRIEGEASLDVLTRMAADPAWQVRAAVVEVLPHQGRRDKTPPQARQIVIDLLEDPDPFVRAKAIDLVASLEVEQAVGRMLALEAAGRVDAETVTGVMVAMGDMRGLRRVIQSLAEEKDPGRRARLIRGLMSYQAESRAQAVWRTILSDDSQREHWALVLDELRGDADHAVALPFAQQMIFEQDEAIAKNAADVIWWALTAGPDARSSDSSPPNWAMALIEKLSEDQRPLHRRWALGMATLFPGPDLAPRLHAALAEDDPAVVTDAVALLARPLVGRQMLGHDLPYSDWHLYRTVARDFQLHGAGTELPKEYGQSWYGPVADLLDHEDQTVRVLAAALIYFVGWTDHDPTTTKILMSALEQDRWQATVMWGVRRRPGPFVDGLDLKALADSWRTRKVAADIMSRVDGPHVEAILLPMGQEARPYDSEILAAVARTGHKDAWKIVDDKIADDRWRTHEILEHLAAAPTEGALAFAERIMQENPQASLHEIGMIAVGVDSDRGRALLEKVLADRRLDRETHAALIARLARVDPAGTRAKLIADLGSTEPQRIGSALRIWRQLDTEHREHEQLMQALIASAQANAQADRPITEWRVVPSLLRREVITRLLAPERWNRLAPMLQEGLLETAIQSPVHSPGVDALLQMKPRTERSRALLTAMVGEQWYAAKQTPDISKMPTSAQPIALPALAYRTDARKKINRFLEVDDSTIASAAAAALGLHLVASMQPEPVESDWPVLLKAAKSRDLATALPAIEALRMHWPDRLADQPVREFNNAVARLRHPKAMTWPIAKTFVHRELDNPSNVAVHRLAVATAVEHADIEFLATAMRYVEYNDDLVPSIPDQVYERPSRRDESPGVLAAIFGARKRSTSAWQTAIEHRDADRAIAELLEIETMPAKLGDMIDAKSRTGQTAALAAAVAYRDSKAVQTLLAMAGDGERYWRSDHRSLQIRSHSAVEIAAVGLSALGNPTHVPMLEKQAQKLIAASDEWTHPEHLIYEVIGRIDPRKAAALLPSDDRAAASLACADDEGWSEWVKAAAIPAHGWVQWHLKAKTNPKVDRVGQRRLSAELGFIGADLASGPTDSAEHLQALLRACGQAAPRGENDNPTSANTGSTIDGPRRLGSDEFIDELELTLTADGDIVDLPDGIRRVVAHGEVEPNLVYLDQLAVQYWGSPQFWMNRAALASGDRAQIVEALRKALAGQDHVHRTAALRLTGTGRFVELDAAVAKALGDAEPEIRAEAVVARAMLDQDKAATWLTPLLTSDADPGVRLVAATTLWQMGQTTGRTVIQRQAKRALAHGMIDRIQACLMQTSPADPADDDPSGVRVSAWTGVSVLSLGRWPGTSFSTMGLAELLATHQSFQRDKVDAMHLRHDRHARPAAGSAAATAPVQEKAGTQPVRADLSSLSLTHHGTLVGAGGLRHGLWSGGRGGDWSRIAMHLIDAEADLEPMVYVQFADQTKNRRDLFERWRAWWDEYGEEPTHVWRRLAAEQAVGELTDARWWHRLRGAARLQRLTGRAVETPGLYDREGWRRLAESWRRWLNRPEHQNSDHWLPLRAREASVLDERPVTAAGPAHSGRRLKLLVQLAGHSDAVLREAARFELEAWPDATKLYAAAIVWQKPGYPTGLAAWFTARAEEATGVKRPNYSPEMLESLTRSAIGDVAE